MDTLCALVIWSKDDKEVILTGIGHIDSHGYLVGAHRDSSTSHQDQYFYPHQYPQKIRVDTVTPDGDDMLAYPVHEHCWNLLLRRHGDDTHPNDIADLLYSILSCTPRRILRRAYNLHANQNLANIDPTQMPIGKGSFNTQSLASEPWASRVLEAREPRQVSQSPTEEQQGNGDLRHEEDDTDASDGEPHRHELAGSRCQESRGLTNNAATTDSFSRLPPDIIYRLLVLLCTADVCRVRLVSRAIAAASILAQLPQSFWASRFSDSRVLGFVLALLPRKPERRNWRGFYFLCKKLLMRETAGCRGFEYRQYAWHHIERIADTLTTLLSRKRKQSSVISGVSQHGSRISSPAWHGADLVWQTDNVPLAGMVFEYDSSPYNSRAYNFLQRGSVRVHRTDMSHDLRIKISCLWNDGQQHILGVRTTAVTSSASDAADSTEHSLEYVGRIFPDKEESISLRPHEDRIVRIDGVLSDQGIHGLRFYVQSPSQTLVYEIGSIGSHVVDFAMAKLEASYSNPITDLCFEFDVRT